MMRGSEKDFIKRLVGLPGDTLAMRDGIVPPTLNLDNPSVDTAIDLVPHQAKKKEVDVALSNSFGFGGTNASLIFRRAA